MRVTFVGHASLLIEANGVRILSDPWWAGPCFGAQWWPYPLPDLQAVKNERIDYVYVSHGHHDHFHPPTLRLFRSAKVLVAAGSDLPEAIRGLGFEVIESDAGSEKDLGNGVQCRIMETYADDTLLAVSAGGESCINLNDSLHAAPEAVQRKFSRLIRQLYGRPDYVFCGYGTASHFPNCYVIPEKNAAATAAMRQAHFNRAWARIVHELQPRFGFPFAADVVFLDADLFWCNEPVHNAERPTTVFSKLFGRSTGTHVIDIAPGFTIEAGTVLRNTIRRSLVAEEVQRAYGDAIRRVNKIAQVSDQTVREVADMLERNIEKGVTYFLDYPADYRCLLQIKGAAVGIRVAKTGRRLRVEVTDDVGGCEKDYDLVYRTRASYLRQSLATRYGHEVLFVGSGGIFEFRNAKAVRAGIHRELMTMVKPFEGAAPRRPVGKGGAVGMAKRVIKRMLGMSRADLYDLENWTVFSKLIGR